MKIVVASLALVICFVVNVRAQVTNIQIYFDANFQRTWSECQGIGVLQDIYVVANNFNADILDIEYRVDYGTAPIIFLGDVAPPGYVLIRLVIPRLWCSHIRFLDDFRLRSGRSLRKSKGLA